MTNERTYPPYPQQSGVAGGGDRGTTQGAVYYPSTPGQGGAPSGYSGQAPQPGSGAVTINRQAFIKAYADMVARSWMDDAYRELILSDPANALAKIGISTLPGAVIRVIEHKITGSGKIEDQIDTWVKGNQTGLYDLFLPMRPEDFDASPGGGAPDACAGGGCCCTPCCCCT